jgi:hypothetical protein
MTDMKKTRFTDEQIIGILKQAEAGMPIKDISRTFQGHLPHGWH